MQTTPNPPSAGLWQLSEPLHVCDRKIAEWQQVSGTIVVRVDGEKCTSDASLFREWAAAFRFPSYFGNNWMAFNECIQEVMFPAHQVLVVCIVHANALLSRAPRDSLETFVDIMKETVTSLSSRGTEDGGPLELCAVFQCEWDKEHAFRSRLSSINVRLSAMRAT